MDRQVLNSRIARNRRNQKIRRVALRVVMIAAALLAVIIIWNIAAPIIKNKKIEAIRQEAAAATTQSASAGNQDVESVLMSPGAEDGSGDAGTKAITDGKVVKNTAPGWQKDENGWWYAADQTSFRYNGWFESDGNQYHLDSNGYIDYGWTPIGGQGYYFNEKGIYDPTKDASKMIALTFDDGPSQYTSDVLDILEQNGARATFFMLGQMVEKHGADTIPRMRALGCSIGNHSYDHQQLLNADAGTIQSEFFSTDNLIAQYNNGDAASVVRFPYGDYTKEGVAATGRAQIFWNVDSYDWDSQNAQAIIQEVTPQIGGGCIILMHDIYPSTVEAVRMLIPDLMAQGYQFVDIETLAHANGYELKSGVTYRGFEDYQKEQNKVCDEND